MSISQNLSSVNCPLGHQQAGVFLRAKDFNRRITEDAFCYYRCSACGLIFLSPIPANLGSYYPTDYYSLPASIEKLDQFAIGLRYQIGMIQRFVQRGRLLEIGPAYGAFARLAKLSGFDVEVIEMDDRCCRYLEQVVGVRTITSNDPGQVLHTLEPKNVIALWHVIEHLPNPWMILEQAAAKLSPGGILLIAAPNPDAVQFRILKSRWPHVDAPRHLQLIPVNLLIQQLAPLGLKPVMVTSNDQGGRSWNVFGWQRTLMNLSHQQHIRFFLKALGLILGKVLGVFESGELKGSAYTAIFQKVKTV